MPHSYYQPEDLSKFSSISKYQETLGKKFFSYYEEVFRDSALSAREKSLIALAVAHAIQCPYCIDAYTKESLTQGSDETQMMEAVHVASAIRAGASLIHGVQMMNKTESLTQ